MSTICLINLVYLKLILNPTLKLILTLTCLDTRDASSGLDVRNEFSFMMIG